MAKKNAELIAETAEILLKEIQASAKEYGGPSHMKDLAEAFALIAQHDTPAPGRPSKVY